MPADAPWAVEVGHAQALDASVERDHGSRLEVACRRPDSRSALSSMQTGYREDEPIKACSCRRSEEVSAQIQPSAQNSPQSQRIRTGMVGTESLSLLNVLIGAWRFEGRAEDRSALELRPSTEQAARSRHRTYHVVEQSDGGVVMGRSSSAGSE